MNHKQLVNNNLEVFYNKVSEENRLEKGMGIFEFERIKSIIQKYITFSPLTIVDVGGGTGKYSEWLAKDGHQVHLVEPILKHVKIAQNRAQRLHNKFTIHQGEARNLELPDGCADIVLLHGPLYHLQSRQDRDLAIIEAKRVLKDNGIILGVAINYSATVLVGLLNGLIHQEPFFQICKQQLKIGMHESREDLPWLLANAFYHRPDQLKEEFSNRDLKFLNIHAVEGMAWLDKDFFSNMLDGKNRETLLELTQIVENDSNLLCFSPHMMIAVQKIHTHGK